MNPAVVHPKDMPENACLVDLHAVVGFSAGEMHSACLIAIDIRHLRAGEFQRIDGHVFPRPCQMEAAGEWIQLDPQERGICPAAATALLSMPLGFAKSVTIGKPLEIGKGQPKGWDQWKFIIAWCWSRWQDDRRRGKRDPSGWSVWEDEKQAKNDSLELRWQLLKRLGYPYDERAFRQACSRMKLRVTESKP